MPEPFLLQQCQLCDDFAVLQDSHIAPNFMERYVKSVSLTKQFTRSTNFNWDSQSAYKEYFLCLACERRLSAREDEFARNIFWPWVKSNQIHTGNQPWLEYFLVSITWRFGRYHERQQAKLNGQCEVCTSPALQGLKDYLMGRSTRPGAFAPRLFYSKVETCAEGDEGAIGGPTPLFDYLTRCYHQRIAVEQHGRGLAMYIKVPHFAIWHTVHGPEWIIDAKKIAEISEKQAHFYARKQIAETTQATRNRRNALSRKKPQQELNDFYNTSTGDNVLRAQQFLDPNRLVHEK
ncbi:MAG TPA: hypothetical protein V6C97_12090 [Oculatellaceae cyanobacterium]